jgi:hypothetical protein
MSRRNEQLMQIAVAIVAERQPYKPVDLVRRLQQDYGASQKAAGETLLYLLHDRRLRQTLTGKLILP